MPYLTYNPEEISTKEFFGGTCSKDPINFSFNTYWRFHNYYAVTSQREYQYPKSEYPKSEVFYQYLAQKLPTLEI